MLNELISSAIDWLPTTPIAGVMLEGDMWATAESIHFIGLSLLIGCIGTFDLRLLGVASQVPISAMHRLIPWGVAGFLMNLVTGLAFYTTLPRNYTYNPAFQMKLLFMAIAGANVLLFYVGPFRRLRTLGAGEPLPIGAKIAGGVSLVAWIGVLTSGRLLTFFNHMRWCAWC